MRLFHTAWPASERPFASLGTWRPFLQQLDDLFGEASGPTTSRSAADAVGVPAPLSDLSETDEHFLLSFDMPGVEKTAINIELEGNQLRLTGERRIAGGDKRVRAYVERRQGRFERVVSLPEGVAAEHIDARYENGVLTVAVQKPAAAKPTKIKVGDGKSGFFGKLLGQNAGKETAAGASDAQRVQAVG